MTQSKILSHPRSWWPQMSASLVVLTILFSAIQLSMVVCQDFEDLTNNNHKFQPLSRQPQLQQHQQQQQVNNKYSNIIRPILSNRFVSSSTGNGGQQLTAQASSSSQVFSGPPALLASPSTGVSSSSSSSSVSQQQTSSVSNIEQLMKNALARTAQMNSATAEPRQDAAASSVSMTASMPPEAAQSSGPMARQRGEQQATNAAPAVPQSSPQTAAAVEDKVAEPSQTSGAPETAQTSSDNEADKTTVTQTVAPNVHDTVYTDQRFANLFARRGNNAKKRITPMEQVKAKPTLPSFIKSLPDPKQFTAVQAQEKPVTPSSFASQRLQQQNLQGRLGQQQGSKKPAITSNSAAQANIKKTNSLNGKQPASLAASPTGPKAISSSANLKAAAAKPSAAPSSNNPFIKSQTTNNDPANVIAMARKRLLANSALESAKLKQQQNRPSTR